MNSKDESNITVVSGLPRSGTSLIMRMLEAGGVPVLTDGLRPADVDNPYGYYEFEPVKNTANDAGWLECAKRKAVKMAYPLLRVLPNNYSYSVIMPRRNISEVVASQNAMLHRLGKPMAPIAEEMLAQSLEAHLAATEEWLHLQPNFAVLQISYEFLIGSPHSAAERLSVFCGGLRILPMAAAVDSSLYRRRMTARDHREFANKDQGGIR